MFQNKISPQIEHFGIILKKLNWVGTTSVVNKSSIEVCIPKKIANQLLDYFNYLLQLWSLIRITMIRNDEQLDWQKYIEIFMAAIFSLCREKNIRKAPRDEPHKRPDGDNLNWFSFLIIHFQPNDGWKKRKTNKKYRVI